MTEPAWVQREREERKTQGLKHTPGQPMTRCPVCFNLGPYCTCDAEILSIGSHSTAEDVIAEAEKVLKDG